MFVHPGHQSAVVPAALEEAAARQCVKEAEVRANPATELYFPSVHVAQF